MSWFRVDDRHAQHDKTRKAHKIEPLSNLLWLNAGTEVAGAGGDGIVRGFRLDDFGHLSGLATPKRLTVAVNALVEVTFWHGHDAWQDCQCVVGSKGWEEKLGRLPDLERGDFLYHDWFDYQLVPKSADVDDLKRARDARDKRLDRSGLKPQIRQRDRDQCRYCGTDLVFRANMTRGKHCGTFDHVDPYLEHPDDNTLDNVVLACKPCNERKSNRTPSAAGMTLRPVPGPYIVSAGGGS